MIHVPLQWFLGDIIFSQTLIRYLAAGERVLWPTMGHYSAALARAYPDMVFIDYTKFNIDYDCKEDKVEDGMHYIPIRWAATIMGQPYKHEMMAKYELYGLNYKHWKKGAMFVRDAGREEALFDYLDLEPGTKYNLINENFQSDARGRRQIKVENGLPNVYIQVLPGWSLFDYAAVIERAQNIHVVSSSIFYLLELLDLSAKEVHLYNRTNAGQGFDNIDYLFTKDYILHD